VCSRLLEMADVRVPPARRGNRVGAPFAVPLAKRGEPKGGGQLMNFGRAIGINPQHTERKPCIQTRQSAGKASPEARA